MQRLGRRHRRAKRPELRRYSGRRWLVTASAASTGCQGPLSTLAPAGRDAAEIAALFWWMLGGALAVWAVMMGLSLYAIRSPRHDRARTLWFMVGGGVVVPALLLSVLLVFGLSTVPRLLEPGAEQGPKIRIVAEQWWWRVMYELPNGKRFELANELRLPVQRRVSLTLESADVIHSFWVPSLAGKVDMLPGRVNRLSLHPLRTGEYLGACAEYCGVSHAKMLFHTVVVEPRAFENWARLQTQPASPQARSLPGRGLFLSHGCGACHTIRGTLANGVIGPDLTHVGGRRAIGAGVVDNDESGFRSFLVSVKHLKPDARMPEFDMLSDTELAHLARYLDRLQ